MYAARPQRVYYLKRRPDGQTAKRRADVETARRRINGAPMSKRRANGKPAVARRTPVVRARVAQKVKTEMESSMFTVCREPELPEMKALTFPTRVREFSVQELQEGLQFEEIECVVSSRGQQLQYVGAKKSFLIGVAFQCTKFYVYGIVKVADEPKVANDFGAEVGLPAAAVSSCESDYFEKPFHKDMFDFLVHGVFPDTKMTAKQRQNWLSRSRSYNVTETRSGQGILWFQPKGEEGKLLLVKALL